MLESLSSLQLSLAALGGLTVLAVLIYNHWTARKNEPRQADPLREPTPSDIEPILSTELGMSPPAASDPVLDDSFANLPLPERKTQLDALIDVIALIEVEQVVSGDAALDALPATRRVGSKLFTVEGLSQDTGLWDGLAPSRRYTAFLAWVQLANRVGAMINSVCSDIVLQNQACSATIGGMLHFIALLAEGTMSR